MNRNIMGRINFNIIHSHIFIWEFRSGFCYGQSSGLKAYAKLGMLMLICLLMFGACSEESTNVQQKEISINEVGYHPDYPKLAVVSFEVEPGEVFRLLDAETLHPIYEGQVEDVAIRDQASGDHVHKLDFSTINKPGSYKLSVPGREYLSNPFRISHTVYNMPVIAAMESFYYQRCGIGINNDSPWEHPACHKNDAPFYDNPERSRNVTGGWHDAGDYAKFIVTTAVSAAFQLYLYEHRTDNFTIDRMLNIPESGNGIPDLLNEVKWGLEWMLKMQNDEGGVYFKVSEKRWTGEYLPHKDPDTRYIFEVSSTATADLAAVAALASQIYKQFDAVLAERLKQAAENAWSFLEKNPGVVPRGGFTNPPDVRGGEYRDSRDLDERLWASVELYRLTGAEKYHQWFLENYKTLGGPKAPPISWQNVDGFAWYSYLRLHESLQNNEAHQSILENMVVYADELTEKVNSNGYRVALGNNEYYWGSNSVVLGIGFELIQAHEITGNELYKRAAIDQLHYILGRNPMGLSYVTGVGYNAARNPYHQFSIRLNEPEPVPGMVVGGPNNQNHLNDVTLSEYPAKTYEDNHKNYMVNETAINYTAPFIYLAGYFADFSKGASELKPGVTFMESQLSIKDENPDNKVKLRQYARTKSKEK